MRVFGVFEGSATWTLAHWQSVLGDSAFVAAGRNTVLLGIGTLLSSLVLSLLLAFVIVRTRLGGRQVLNLVVWIPWALPGLLLGLGLLWMFLGNPLTAPLFGSVPLLVFALTIAELPVSVQLLKGALLQIHAELEEAATTSGASRLVAVREILLPLMAPTLVAVGLVVLIVSIRETSTVVLLSTAQSRPLSVLMLEYLIGSSEYERAAVVGTVLAGSVSILGLLAWGAGYRVGVR
jgi:iron(III) transport system permease protein